MKRFSINPISKKLLPELKCKIGGKTKPIGALGRLEELAIQLGRIQNTLSPSLKNPHIIVFAGDHGIAREGVSAYAQEVTRQMVMNFVSGGAAINVFCRQHRITLKVVDAGVNFEFPKRTPVIHSKIGCGTNSFLFEPAMTTKQAESCIEAGAAVVEKIARNGCNVVGFGDMGIGNTTSASALMSVICRIPIEHCIGRGTGLDERAMYRKADILKQSLALHGRPRTPLKTLAAYGGFEIGQICGAMLQAAERRMLLLVDGFIATSAFLLAHEINSAVLSYAIFCHQSNESGHGRMLEYLRVRPLLNLDMRLGEGTGAAVAYPLIQSAVNFLNEMASFEAAGVSRKKWDRRLA